jgi:hypothetical protein
MHNMSLYEREAWYLRHGVPSRDLQSLVPVTISANALEKDRASFEEEKGKHQLAVNLNPRGRHWAASEELHRLGLNYVTVGELINTPWLSLVNKVMVRGNVCPFKFKVLRELWSSELKRANVAYRGDGQHLVQCVHCGGISNFVA